KLHDNNPDVQTPVLDFLARQQSHVEWTGATLHDLIQPSFSFLVGVALAFSLASRLARGQSELGMAFHALFRSIVLVLLGVYLRSTHSPMTNWTFEDTLTQIGLGYFPLYLIGRAGGAWRWVALVLIVVGYWFAFVLYPWQGFQIDWSPES